MFLILVTSEYRDNFSGPGQKYECSICIPRSEAKPLPSNYSTAIGKPVENEKNPAIDTIIYGNQFALLNPTKKSEHHSNYIRPDKEDYVKRRTQVFVPKYDEPAIGKDASSTYSDTYIDHKQK